MGYLIGEKMLGFAREAQRSPQFAAELTAFAAEVRAIFTPAELRRYLEGVNRVGVFGHVVSDEQYEFIRASGVVEDDPVAGAEDVLLLARVSELLLPR